MTEEWRLVSEDIKLIREMPSYREIIANVYECSKCENKANDYNGLPEKCPWCGSDMKMEEVEA